MCMSAIQSTRCAKNKIMIQLTCQKSMITQLNFKWSHFSLTYNFTNHKHNRNKAYKQQLNHQQYKHFTDNYYTLSITCLTLYLDEEKS